MEYFYSLWKSALPISNTPSLAERLDDVIITSSSMGGVTSRFLSGWRMRTQDDGPAGKVHHVAQCFLVRNMILSFPPVEEKESKCYCSRSRDYVPPRILSPEQSLRLELKIQMPYVICQTIKTLECYPE